MFNNVGPGYVKINGRTLKDNSEDTTVKEVDKIIDRDFGPFNANRLDLQLTSAKAKVEPCTDNEISVKVRGPKSIADSIEVRKNGQTIAITEASSASNQNVFMSSGNVVVTGGGSISVSSIFSGNRNVSTVSTSMSSNDSPLEVIIKVPVGTNIAMTTIRGGITIGDIQGNLIANVMGSGDITVGKVHDVQLIVQGSGNTDISYVNGAADLKVMSSGDVNIDDSNITQLMALAIGSGDICVGGVCQNAVATTAGSGDIDIGRVINTPVTSQVGNGDIRAIGNFVLVFGPQFG